MTHTSITSPPHSSYMYTFLQTLQTLFKPPRNNSSISLFHVNSFEILKYVTKEKQKRKRKRQGKRKEKKKEKERNRRSEKKENKLEEYLLFSTPPSLPFPSIPTSITIHIIWELNYHKWYHLCFLNPFCLHTCLLLTTSFL